MKMDKAQAVLVLMLGLILVYLLVKNASSVAQVMTALAGSMVGVFGTLQGRSVNAFGVQLGT